ncbi:MarR family transcriptional regulator [uncultured Roseobacter sp.]|uniref:MarR family winged helix-turn-helix transcriptional regulator n=1 Tax=uncultured Roseobacter sp. TaxID=114847 RepID=UPI00261A0FF5|nr:MarR family transcriptional regulator [uncultured Roseobacter sp.]
MPSPDETTPQDLVAACRRLYASIDRLDTKAANTVGVSRNDLRCLNMLAEAPVKPSKIAAELGLTTGSVTTLLDRLERADLARRERDPDDRRGVIVHPTPYLFETLGPIYSGVAREIERIAAEYSADERKAAVKHLNDASSAYEAVTSVDDR